MCDRKSRKDKHNIASFNSQKYDVTQLFQKDRQDDVDSCSEEQEQLFIQWVKSDLKYNMVTYSNMF